MARGRRRTSYTRDNRGRFSSSPGGGAPKRSTPATRRAAMRAGNRLNRDNSGRISGIGRDGATVRGGRLKTAKGNRRATQLASMKAAPLRSGTIAKGGRGIRGSVARSLAAVRKERMAGTKPVVASPVKPAARGPKVKLPRMATPTGVIRGSDRAKVKADARKGIGTPMSRAGQRAIARSAREAPLIRRQAIAAARRKGRTGFGKGPQMNTGSIGNRDFNWNRNEQPATARERLAMWQKGERRARGMWSGGRGVAGAAAGDLRASRRAAALVDSGDRLGNLPTTRKMAEQPRQRRVDRVNRNETRGSLASYEADRRLLPQIQKVRDAAQKRIAEGKKPTAAQREKERKLVGEYNKATRQFLVAKAAKSYMQNPYGFKPQRMSGAVKAAKKPTAPKRTRASRPAGTVAKPRGMKPGVLAARRVAKAAATKPKAGPGSLQAITARRARVTKGIKQQEARMMQALRNGSMGSLSRSDEIRMRRGAITRSAANEIYNRQRTVAKISGKELDRQSLSSPLSIMRTIRPSKDKLQMATQLRERARTRVIKGRKGRR